MLTGSLDQVVHNRFRERLPHERPVRTTSYSDRATKKRHKKDNLRKKGKRKGR